MYIDDNISPVPVMIFTIPIVAIVGGRIFSIVKTVMRARVRELEIRERIAMIERGMVPPPEIDPGGFERRMERLDFIQHRHAGNRFRAGGIMVVSIGLGLMTLLWFVGVPRVGIGLGGFVMFIGLGLLVNSAFAAPRPVDVSTRNPTSSGPANPD